MDDILCYSIDTESVDGKPIAERYGVGGLPTLIVLESDGEVRDRWSGYLPPEPFIEEIERIARNEGTLRALRAQVERQPKDIEARYAYAQKLQQMNDAEGYAEQLAAIKRLDPEGTHLVSRRMALAETMQTVLRSSDPKADELLQFLADETDSEMLFQGHELISRICSYRLQTATGDEANAHRRQLLASYRIAWTNRPEGSTSAFGNSVAWSLWEQREGLDAEAKAFALEVARAAAEQADEDPNVLDTLACCLFMNGQVEEAIRQAERCVELAPDNEEFQSRLELFRAGS